MMSNTLTVALTGSGAGTVTSDPAGIGCGAICSATYAAGTSIALTASAGAGAVFTGWTGACEGVGACVVTIVADTTVTARFSTVADSLWLTTAGGNLLESLPRIALAPDGDLVVVGAFSGQMMIGGNSLTAEGDFDMFIAKISAVDGALLWSRRVGGPERDMTTEIRVATDGSIILTGLFQQTINFGSGTLVAVSDTDIFVAKLSGVDGSAIWAQRLGGATINGAYSVALDAAGDLFLAGQFMGSLDFGGGARTSSGSIEGDGFVAKYSGADGSWLWDRVFPSTLRSVATAVEVMESGDVVVTGTFEGTVDLGGITSPTSDAVDVFLSAYRGLDGGRSWSRMYVNPGDQASNALSARGPNVVVAGKNTGTMTFNADVLSAVDALGDGFVVGFVAGTDATYQWSRGFGAAGLDEAFDVAMGPAGEVLVTGRFTSSADLGGGALLSVGGTDALLTKLAATNGAHLWSRRYGGPANDAGFSVNVDAGGVVYLGGTFEGAAVFATEAAMSAGSADIFFLSVAP